jgi:hypothetical protein
MAASVGGHDNKSGGNAVVIKFRGGVAPRAGLTDQPTLTGSATNR